MYTKPPRNEIGSEMPGGIDAAMIVVLEDKQITAATAEECKVLEQKQERDQQHIRASESQDLWVLICVATREAACFL